MALKLVTAPPGTGKTLLLIKMIFEYLAQGRRVYSNIDQLKIAEVLPLPHNADWRDYPDGSVIIYDEAQEHVAFSSDDLTDFEDFEEPEQLENENVTAFRERVRKLKADYDRRKRAYLESIKDIARGFQVHRHFGFDIILATQDQSFLNNLAKKCVGEHYHLTRPFGLKGNMIFFWRRLVTNPDSRTEKASAEWKKHINFKKSYFNLYRSANVHTHKSSIPIKYIIVGLIILALCCLPFYLISNNKSLKMMQGEEGLNAQNIDNKNDVSMKGEMPKTPEQLAAFQKEQELQAERERFTQEQRDLYAQRLQLEKQKKEEIEISGCIKFNGRYTAVDEYGRYIPEKSHLCRDVIERSDRRAMKLPSRSTYSQYNTYSASAQQDLESSRLSEQQREYFNEP